MGKMTTNQHVSIIENRRHAKEISELGLEAAALNAAQTARAKSREKIAESLRRAGYGPVEAWALLRRSDTSLARIGDMWFYLREGQIKFISRCKTCGTAVSMSAGRLDQLGVALERAEEECDRCNSLPEKEKKNVKYVNPFEGETPVEVEEEEAA